MDITQLSDAELIQKCLANNDQSAFAILVDRYRTDIYRIIYHFLKNSEDTLDAMQEVFIKAYSSLSLLQDRTKFKPWLIKIAVNQAVDYYRKRNLLNLEPNTDNNQDTSKVESTKDTWKNNPRKISEIKEINQQISEAVSQLSKHQRIVFILRYFEEMQISEIAVALSCSEGTVKSNLHHATKHLRTLLGNPEKKGVQRYVNLHSNPTTAVRIPVWGIIADQLAEIQ
ncbi:MAG: RNA polymerase sigma factor [bacterium]